MEEKLTGLAKAKAHHPKKNHTQKIDYKNIMFYYRLYKILSIY